MKKVYWLSERVCDICHQPIVDDLYDAKTMMGPWGTLCQADYMKFRFFTMLGTGFGQHYKQQPDGKFLKVEG